MKLAVVKSEFTRPADTNAYAQYDVVCGSTTEPALLEFASVAQHEGKGGWIRKIKAYKNSTNITNASFRLHLFNKSITAVADNAQFPRLYANRDKYVGYIDFVFASGGTGSDCAFAYGTMSSDNMPLSFKTENPENKLYGVLEAQAAYTPASGELFSIQLEIEQDA